MADIVDIEVTLRQEGENDGVEPADTVIEIGEVMSREETQNSGVSCRRNPPGGPSLGEPSPPTTDFHGPIGASQQGQEGENDGVEPADTVIEIGEVMSREETQNSGVSCRRNPPSGPSLGEPSPPSTDFHGPIDASQQGQEGENDGVEPADTVIEIGEVMIREETQNSWVKWLRCMCCRRNPPSGPSLGEPSPPSTDFHGPIDASQQGQEGENDGVEPADTVIEIGEVMSREETQNSWVKWLRCMCCRRNPPGGPSLGEPSPPSTDFHGPIGASQQGQEGENDGVEPADTVIEIGEVMSREETQNSGVKRRRSMWRTAVIVILIGLLCGVTTFMVVQIYQQQRLHSFLFDDLSFLWKYCNKDTLQCSRCPPGWVEHDSRCFFLSREPENWETARSKCLAIESDLAVVLNAEDQSFLTNMTLQFQQQHPEEYFHSAWIGLQDMAHEGIFKWVNGNRLSKDVTFWKPLEPNNALATWDKTQAGQDCVAIVPPKQTGENDNWLNNWDDIICVGQRHYLCETPALSVS